MIRSAGSCPAQGRGRALAVRTRVRIGLVLWLAAGAVGLTQGAAAQAGGPMSRVLTVAETETFARRVDFEGMDEQEASRIGAEGAARLVEMLGDPDEKPHHARILLALGISGGEGAFEAISDWAGQRPAGGELDRSEFRAWQVLPFALGKLAHRDPRALSRLAACFDAEAPAWTFRHFKGARLQTLERRAAVVALAETGTPEALRVLDAVERRASDPALAAHVRAVRAQASGRPAGAAR